MSPNSITAKVVIVTGGASGIGFDIADKFLQKEAKVVIIVDVLENGDEVVKELDAKHGSNKTIYYKGDVTKQDFLDAVFEEVTKRFKTIDVLVNNAGIVDEIDWKKCMNVNTMAVMEWTLKLFQHMRTDTGGRGGTIINMSSIFGFRKYQFVPIYSTSKFAVLGFTKCLGHEYNYNSYGVRVVALCPGYTRTNMPNNSVQNIWDNEQRKTDMLKAVSFMIQQEVGAVGRAAVEVMETAASGTAWLIEGDAPLTQV